MSRLGERLFERVVLRALLERREALLVVALQRPRIVAVMRSGLKRSMTKMVLRVPALVGPYEGLAAAERARVQRSQVWGIDGGGLCVFSVSSVEWRCSNPVAGGSVHESGQKPLLSRSRVGDCSRHSYPSSEGNSDFVFPSVLDSFC